MRLSRFSACLAAALVSAPLLSCEPSSAAGSVDAAAVPLEQPVELPELALPASDGTPYPFAERGAGRVVLLFFGYTYCPDICPVHLANLAAVLRDLPLETTRDIELVFVTADPERDTPERLGEWLGALHPRFVGVRGTRGEVNALERSLGLPESVVDPTGGPDGSYFVGHAGQILVFGRDGTAHFAYPFGTRQRDWLRDLPRLVRGETPPLAQPSAGAS
jgi:protein SCO1